MFNILNGCENIDFSNFFLEIKAKLLEIQRYTLITLHPKAPLYNIIIIVDTVLRQKEILNTKNIEVNNIAILPLWHERPMPARRQSNVRGTHRR